MTDTTPEPLLEPTPFAVPARPTTDAIIDPVWGQWVHDLLAGTDPARKVTIRSLSKTTGASDGTVTFTPAELGLTTVQGGFASILRVAPSDNNYLMWIGEQYVYQNLLYVRCGGTTLGSPVALAINATRTFTVLAWGV